MINCYLSSRLKEQIRCGFIASLLTFANNGFAGIFDSNTQVRKFVCDVKTGKLTTKDFLVVTYIVEKDAVFEKSEFVSSGKVIGNSLDKLEYCQVLDKRNWKCGGNTDFFPTGVLIRYSINQVVDGKYSFSPTTYNNKSANPFECKYEQVN